MKEPWNWEEEDIEELVREAVQESLLLDYKRCASLDKRNPKSRTELSKDVSAFANSAGGTLVYGVEEDNHLPRAIDEGYEPADLTREWIEQIINSTIQRRIDGVRIKQIRLKRSHPGRVMYVICIPQSNRAPHMAEDHVFYKRYNYQSVSMEEYEVRDVAHRSEAPDLQLFLHLAGSPTTDLTYEGENTHSKPISLMGGLLNKSPVPAMYLVIKLYIDASLQIVNAGEMSPSGELALRIADREIQANVLNLNWATPGKMPVWESVSFQLTNTPIQLAVPRDQADYFLVWEIHSPGMSPRKGVYILKTSNNKASLEYR